MNAETFNSLYPVGAPVFAYPGFRPQDDPTARRLVTRTRSKAQKSASGHDVVWVDGEGSYITLTHIDVITEAEFAALTPWRVRFKGSGFRLSAEHATEEQAYAAARQAAACAAAGKPVTFAHRIGSAERSCMNVRGIAVLHYDQVSGEWRPHSRGWSARTQRPDALTPLRVTSAGGAS